MVPLSGALFIATLSFSIAFASTVRLPDLPAVSLEGFAPATRQGFQEAYARVRRNPADSELNGQLAMKLHAYELYKSAEVCYWRAHLLDPSSFKWTYLLGIVQGLEGKKAESLVSLRKAMSQNPNYRPGRIKLAESLLDADKVGQSIEVFKEVLQEEPDSPLARYGLGRALMEEGRTESAVEHLRLACQLRESFGAAHYSLGLAYRDLGRLDQARDQFALYRKSARKWPAANDRLIDSVKQLKVGAREHLTLGVKLARANRLEEAVKEHEKALQLDPQLVQAHIHLISLYSKLGQPEKAEYDYRKSVEINPSLSEGHYNFGVLMSSLGRYKEAAQAFRKALEINPHYAHAHNNLGYMLQTMGQLQEAVKHFRRAIKNDPSYRLARFNLGRALVALGKNEEAIEQFSRTLTPEDEKTPRFMFALAAAYVRKGDLRRGIDYAQGAKRRATDLGQAELARQIDKDLQRLRKTRKRP
ncbi:MAG: tetratricopeptide repeat protein [Acidobacteriota bacterium]